MSSKKKQEVLADFTGGLNVDVPPERLNKKELAAAENVNLDERGIIKKRAGTDVCNSTSFEKEVEKLIFWQTSSGSEVIIAVFSDNKIAKLKQDSDDAVIASTSDDTEDNDDLIIDFYFSIDGEDLILNDTNIAYFFRKEYFYFLDGDNFYQFSLVEEETEKVEAPLTETESKSGEHHSQRAIVRDDDNIKWYIISLDNTYLVEDDFELNMSMAVDSDTDEPKPSVTKSEAERPEFGDNGGVSFPYEWVKNYSSDLTQAEDPYDPEDGDDYGIDYEEGELVYYADGLLENRFLLENGKFGDNYVSYSYEKDPSILDPIKKCNFSVRHPKSQRIFYAGNAEDSQAVYYSEYAEPGNVKGGNVVYPSVNEGPVMGLKVFMDYVLVFYKYSLWIWGGIDPERDAIWEKVPVPNGTISNNSIKLTPNSLTYLSEKGLYSITPSILGLSGKVETNEGVKNIARDRVTNLIKSMQNRYNSVAVYDSQNERYLLAYDSDGSGDNDSILVYDWKINVFTKYKGLKVNDFAIDQAGIIYIASENYILRFDEDKDSDHDVTENEDKIIEVNIKTKELTLNAPFNEKKLYKFLMNFENYDNDNLEFEIIVRNEDEQKDIRTITGQNDKTFLTAREKMSYTGSKFQFEIKSSQYTPMRIYAIGLNYSIVKSVGDIV